MEELLSLTKKPESMALPLAVSSTGQYQIRKPRVFQASQETAGDSLFEIPVKSWQADQTIS